MNTYITISIPVEVCTAVDAIARTKAPSRKRSETITHLLRVGMAHHEPRHAAVVEPELVEELAA